ncbi:MAG: DNA polymerase IV [Candidatus Uhrbacteria bacterium]
MNRIIIHIDMNSYFASVEQQANPFLRGKAIGVTGKRKERSVVAAASREAKKLGVKTAMSTWEAKRILPSIILVAGDPEKYGDITRRFNAIFRDYTPLVEQFSVDESFLDVTDVAQDYLGATAIALAIRERLRVECGDFITASIGIGPNKLLAKLASETVKPSGLTVIRPHEAIDLLDRCALQDLCGIGPRIADRLGDLGIRSFAQLRQFPLDKLAAEFKSYGLWLHNAAHGIGDDVVSSVADDPKSVGHSYTLPADTSDPTVVQRHLLALCDKVAWRLRRDGFAARCVTAYVRFGDFSGAGKQHRFQEPTNNGLELFKIAWSLIRQNGSDVSLKQIRLVGISTSELITGSKPTSLFRKDRNVVSTLHALDKLQTRYGDRAWTRASLLSTNVMERTSGFRYDHEL